MANSNADADRTIDALLQQRSQYEQWLARLNETGDKAPPGVRDRVRSDYETRLQQVIDELRSHATTITNELEQHRAAQQRLDADRQTAAEALAEAEVRHLVGEYTDEEWQRLQGEREHHLAQVRTELEAVGGEIARLAEVQALIEAPAPVVTVPPTPPPAPVPTPTPVATVSPIEPVAPTPIATAHHPAPAPATPAMDELTFLKSVSDDDEKPAVSPRRTGATATAKPVEAATATAPSGAAGTGASKAPGVAKTLKCNECGTFNRPTEWYCERCGAELAAL